MDKQKVLFYVLLISAGGFAYAALLLSQNLSGLYLILLIPGVVLGLLGYEKHRQIERTKLLSKLSREWGVDAQDKERKLDDIALLFKYTKPRQGDIDDRTWHDLNMDFVFSKLDRTLTWPGMQCLYLMLRSPEIEDLSLLEKRSRMIRSFQDKQAQRETIQLKLSKMDGRLGSGLATLLWSTPEVPRIHPQIVYLFMSTAALLSPLLLFFGLRWLIVMILIFQANMFLHFNVQKRIKPYFEGVRALGQLINLAKDLSLLEYDAIGEPLSEIKDALQQVKGFLKMTRYVGMETTDPAMAMVLQYHQIFLLAEVRGFYRALDFIAANKNALQKLFLSVGKLDAYQSVASYRCSLDTYCEPVFLREKSLNLKDAYHPLIRDAVPNSINVRERGILVTGSNMSGKSTFLRTVGLNVLLAQSIATCLADKYEGVPVHLLTCIGRADNVVEGKSYYLEEALSVKRIIKSLNTRVTTLAIFDEMFRGTNSEERIFAARRVLQYLISRNSMVFVATHDLELAALLTHNYRSVHFSERLGALGLEFDYKLKEGPATTKNAIALLRYLEYPREITEPEVSMP